MATKDEVLREKTYKEDGMELERRVHYTLADKDGLQAHRNSKAIALLIRRLTEKGVLSEEEVDEILFECVW